MGRPALMLVFTVRAFFELEFVVVFGFFMVILLKPSVGYAALNS